MDGAWAVWESLIDRASSRNSRYCAYAQDSRRPDHRRPSPGVLADLARKEGGEELRVYPSGRIAPVRLGGDRLLGLDGTANFTIVVDCRTAPLSDGCDQDEELATARERNS